MDKLSDRELERIESRLDAFEQWFERVNADRTGYDSEAAMEDFRMIAADMRRLLEQVRAWG